MRRGPRDIFWVRPCHLGVDRANPQDSLILIQVGWGLPVTGLDKRMLDSEVR